MVILYKMNTIINQFAKFLIVGALNTLIGLGIILFCLYLLEWTMTMSNVTGYSFALFNSYVFNKKWTFSYKNNELRVIALFFAVFFVSYFFQLGVVILLYNNFELPKYLIQILGIGVYTISNFLGNKLLTFRV